MDWGHGEEFEAAPIPTLPGSSLSVYYDNLIDGDGSEDGGEAPDEEERAARPDRRRLPLAEPGVDDDGDDDVEEDEDEDEEGGGGGRRAEAAGRGEGPRSLRGSGSEDADSVAHDEFGFLELTDPGLGAALDLRESLPPFDETGLTTYKELCRAMDLHPISRFARQLSEGLVDLKFYGVNPPTMRVVAQALMYNPTVHTLDLTGNWMNAGAAFYMSELMLRENIAMRHLLLRGCRLGPDAAAVLAEGIELNKSLRTLDLADNLLGDGGVVALQEALAHNDELRELDLSNNNLGAVAAAALGNALLENQNIEVLRLARNNLFEDTPKGLRVLLRALQQRETSIQSLDLAWNALNETAAAPLRAFLVRSAVRELFLNNNRLPGPAIDTIKIGARKSVTLQHLKIGFNPMEPDNAMNLLKACRASESLHTLDLDGIRVNPDFLKIKKELEESKGKIIIIEGALSNYEIKGPNLKEMMLKRAHFEGFKPKKKRRKKDFGHLLLELAENGIESILPDQFTEAALKRKKIKVREELLRALYEQFQTKTKKVDVTAMLNCYMQLFPSTVLPPPVLKKKVGKKKKKKIHKGKLKLM